MNSNTANCVIEGFLCLSLTRTVTLDTEVCLAMLCLRLLIYSMGVLPHDTGLAKINWQSTCTNTSFPPPYPENSCCIAKNLPFHRTSELSRMASSGPTSWGSIFHHRCHGLVHSHVLWNIPEDQILELLSAPLSLISSSVPLPIPRSHS